MIEQFLIAVARGDKETQLSQYCTLDFIKEITPLAEELRPLDRMIKVRQVQLMGINKTNLTNKAEVVFIAEDRGRLLRGQVRVLENKHLMLIDHFAIV